MTDSNAMPLFYRKSDPRAAFAASGLCWAIFLAVALWVMSGNSSHFDEAGIAIFRTAANRDLPGPEWVLEAVRDGTALGGVILRNLIALIALAALLMLGFRRQATVLLFTVAGGWAVGVTLKMLVMRARPDNLSQLMDASGFSFPSGHTFNATVVYLSLGLIAASFARSLPRKYGIVALTFALAMSVGLTRIMLGVHYPTDVIAGLAGGAGWTFFCAALSSWSSANSNAFGEQARDDRI